MSINTVEDSYNENRFFYADSSVLDIFDIPFIKGDPGTALNRPFTVLMTESTARRYFGGDNPVGESMRFNGGPEVMITGIFSDAPRNSHLKPDIVVSWETMVRFRGPDINTAWQWDGFFNYILLNPASDYKEFEAKIPAFVEAEIGEDMRQWDAGVVFHLQPLRSIHLHSDFMFEAEPNGNARSVYALMAIAVFLVLIAWINYINLSSSRSLERAREVGMRKVTGALRKHLMGQFLIEVVLVNLLAVILAVLLVMLLDTPFNRLTGESLDYGFRSNPGFWVSPPNSPNHIGTP